MVSCDKMSSVSSSSFSSSLFLVVCISRVCNLVVRCWLGCRRRGDRGRGSCWLFESAAHEVAFHGISVRIVFRGGEPCHVMSLAKSSSMSWPVILCFQYPFCLVDIVEFQLDTNWFRRSSWCLALILACLRQIWLCLRIHDVIPLAANKSSTLCVALIM